MKNAVAFLLGALVLALASTVQGGYGIRSLASWPGQIQPVSGAPKSLQLGQQNGTTSSALPSACRPAARR